MAELIAFGREIARGMGIGRDLRAKAFDDIDPRRKDSRDLDRVVRHQAHGGDSQKTQNLDRQAIAAPVYRVAELEVGFYCVEAVVLERVGSQLVHESYAAALLVLIDENARPFMGDAAESKVELIVAVAAQRVKDVACCALRMNTNNGRAAMDVAEYKSECGFRCAFGALRNNGFKA